MLDHPYVLALLTTVLGLGLGWSLERLFRRRNRWRPRVAYQTRESVRSPKPGQQFEATDQLKVVMSAVYRPRTILSAREARVFDAAQASIAGLGLDWRVMAQVSLGEVLSSDDPSAYAAINSKRVDILLVDGKGWPKAGIEYQGSGHHQGTAAARDAVKKEALRRAGVHYVEVLEGQTSADLHSAIARISGRPVRPASALSPAAARRAEPSRTPSAPARAAPHPAG